jgi:D-sedoheptulose 7-phosphate isomerase
MRKRIEEIFEESIAVKKETVQKNANAIQEAASVLIDAFKNGGKVILFGNGGSAADSQHIAAEFIGRFQKERKSLPAIALTTDTSILTALGNDYGFDIVFSRQLEGLARRGDVAIVFSTSGNSKNVIEAVKTAQRIGIKTISLTGNGGGKLAGLTDVKIVVPSKVTARIQESHGLIAHVLCELVEEALSA